MTELKIFKSYFHGGSDLGSLRILHFVANFFAIFENQQRVSSLPDVDDPENSAIDAVILARYVWLTACRYPEQEQTLCLCVSEHGDSAYVIPPAGRSLGWSPERPIAPEELYSWLGAQFLS